MYGFNPRSPCGERRCILRDRRRDLLVSTHAPLAGSDISEFFQFKVLFQFQPTLPLRGATLRHDVAPVVRHVSTHAPLAGSDEARSEGPQEGVPVSTHAPLAGSDFRLRACPCSGQLVSTHAPLAGSDYSRCPRFLTARGFNPRSPCGERLGGFHGVLLSVGFNPRSPCGERRRRRSRAPRPRGSFNPRSPCGERRTALTRAAGSSEFQPTLPLRGATARTRPRWTATASFNPRSPCGERPPSADRHTQGSTGFQPTLPLRGATSRRAPSDCSQPGFNPRSPCGERLLHLVNIALRAYHIHGTFHSNAPSDKLRPPRNKPKSGANLPGNP